VNIGTLILRRRRIRAVLLIGGLIAILTGWLQSTVAPAAEGSRPNIVFILADDMGFGDVAAYNPDPGASGAPPSNRLQAETPNIDTLASQGMRFTNAHSPSAVCTPTRYGLLTGRHAYRSIRGLGVQSQYSDLFLQSGDGRTVADVLKSAGYTTGFIGKWHLGYHVYNSSGGLVTGAPSNQSIQPDWNQGLGEGPAARGFDFSFGHVTSTDFGPYKYFQNDEWVNTSSVWTTGQVEFGVDLMREGWRDPNWNPHTVTRNLRDRTIQYIADQALDTSQPFYLQFSLSAPHTPTAPHADFAGTTAGNYTDFVAELDDAVGAITGALQQHGLAENTLVIFAADNGAFEGYSKRAENNPTHEAAGYLQDSTGVVKEIRGQKFDTYEGGHRVPFIAKWGDGTPIGSTIQPGAITDEIINLQDFYRTAATLAGASLRPTEGVDSFSILPVLEGDGTDLELREATFSTSDAGAFSISSRDDQGVQWKLIYSRGAGRSNDTIVNANQANIQPHLSNLQLYNLAIDLGETTNLLTNGGVSSSELTKVLELHAMMYGYLASGNTVPQSVLGLYGDFNNDGAVDAADYTVWRNNLGTSFDLGGKGDEGGASAHIVDLADYDLWKSNYGATFGSFAAGVANVPEPSSTLLCLIGLAAISRHRLRRRSRASCSEGSVPVQRR